MVLHARNNILLAQRGILELLDNKAISTAEYEGQNPKHVIDIGYTHSNLREMLNRAFLRGHEVTPRGEYDIKIDNPYRSNTSTIDRAIEQLKQNGAISIRPSGTRGARYVMTNKGAEQLLRLREDEQNIASSTPTVRNGLVELTATNNSTSKTEVSLNSPFFQATGDITGTAWTERKGVKYRANPDIESQR